VRTCPRRSPIHTPPLPLELAGDGEQRRLELVPRDQEVDFYVNVDFLSQVVLIAVLEEDGRLVIVGGARDIVVQPGQAEVAFAS
jgi:hypothetical protein